MTPADSIAFFRKGFFLLCLAIAFGACGNSGGDSSAADASLDDASSANTSGGDAADAVTFSCPSQLPSDSDCASVAPSYDGVIAPIIVSRCTSCHSPTGVEAGTLFDTYARIKADMMQVHLFTQVYNCLMPPPGAPPLTPSERETLLQWFVCDAPRGDAAAADDAGPGIDAPSGGEASSAEDALGGDEVSPE